MAKVLLSDDLWSLIGPLLPAPKPRPRGGRPPISNRAVLTGILFVLRTGIPWEYLPQEMGCGSGMTCWRRLRDWQQAGVWGRVHRTLLKRLREADRIDWSRAVVDSSSIRAVGGAKRQAPTRRIGPAQARSIMFSQMVRECLSPSPSRERTPTM
jgi:transposase